MKAYSTIQPVPILVADKSGLNLKLCVRWNIKETVKSDIGATQTEYEYDEVYIDHVIPPEIKLDDINTYLATVFPMILIQANTKANTVEPVIVKNIVPTKTLITVSAIELNKLISDKVVTK